MNLYQFLPKKKEKKEKKNLIGPTHKISSFEGLELAADNPGYGLSPDNCGCL